MVKEMNWLTKLTVQVASYLPLIGLTLPGLLGIVSGLSVDLSECNKELVASFVRVVAVIMLAAYALVLFCGYSRIAGNRDLELKVVKEWRFNSIVNIGLFLMMSAVFSNTKATSCDCLIDFVLYKSILFLLLSVSLLTLSYLSVKKIEEASGTYTYKVHRGYIAAIFILLIGIVVFFWNDISESKVSEKIYHKYFEGDAPSYPCVNIKNTVNK